MVVKALHPGLIVFGRLLQLRHLLGKLNRFTGGREMLLAGLAQSCGKCLVHLVIGQAFGLVRKLLLFLADGKGRQRLRNLPGVQVDDGRLAGSPSRLTLLGL